MDCRKGTAVEGGGEVQSGDVVGRTGKKEEGEMWEEEGSLLPPPDFHAGFPHKTNEGRYKTVERREEGCYSAPIVRKERKGKKSPGEVYRINLVQQKRKNRIQIYPFSNIKNFFMRQTEYLSPRWPPSPASAPAVGPPRGRRRTWCPGGGRPYHRQPQPRINLRGRKRKSFSFSFFFSLLCGKCREWA